MPHQGARTRQASYANYKASGSFEQCGIVTDLAAKVAQTIRDICCRLGVDAPQKGYDLCGVHLHIVLDEMEELPNLVKLIVRDHNIFCGMVRGQLAALRGTDGNKLFKFGTGSHVSGAGLVSNLTVTTAVVGGHIDFSDLRMGSIGEPHRRLFVRTSPYTFLRENGLAEGVAKVPVLHALASNFRCAAILVDKMQDTREIRCEESFCSLFHKDLRPLAYQLLEVVVDEYIRASAWGGMSDDEVVLRSAQIISLLFAQHFEAFPCHMLGDEDVAVLCGKLGAIDDRLRWVDTKPVIDRTSSPSPLADDEKFKGLRGLYAATPPNKSKKYTDIRFRSAVLKIPEAAAAKAISWWDSQQRKQQHPNLRFDVTPAIAIIAITQFAKQHNRHPFAGDDRSSFESLTAVALSAVLYLAGRKGVDVPLGMLLTSFGRGGEVGSAPPKVLGTDDGEAVNANDVLILCGGEGNLLGAAVPAFVEAPYMHSDAEDESIAALVGRSHCVVESAAPNAAQSEVTVHAKGFIVGFDCKHKTTAYDDGGDVVDVMALAHRALQMGYMHVEVTVPYYKEERMYDSSHGGKKNKDFTSQFFVGSSVRAFIKNMPENTRYMRRPREEGGEVTFFISTFSAVGNSNNCCAAVRSAVVRAAKSRAEGGSTVRDVLILCGPDATRPLIPEDCSVTFRKRMDMCETDPMWKSAVEGEESGEEEASKTFANKVKSLPNSQVKMRYDESKSVSVTCWALSMELLVCSTMEGQLPFPSHPRPSPRHHQYTSHVSPAKKSELEFVCGYHHIQVESRLSVDNYSEFEARTANEKKQ